MKSFGAILLALAASVSLVAALPAPGVEAHGHGLQSRAPMYYAQHIHEARSKHRGQGSFGNGTFPANGTVEVNPGNNGTANGTDNANGNGNGRGNGKGNGRGRNGNGRGNNRNNGDDNGLIAALLALLGAALNGQGQGQGRGAGGAAAGNNNPLAIIQGLLNNAA
ncbi:hypothetical protein F5Y14DRAFT_263210 [Nemania sp. NC0429]|nr:hypothetical protein F5Y14DRAFT_263210 [Nemania sp. NC0429]